MKDAGIVAALTGKVIAIATDGTERLLALGEKVYDGEKIVTGEFGAVSIEFANGLVMDLGRNDQSILDEATLNLDFDIEPKTETVTSEVEATQKALLTDKDFDPTLDLDPTAAGQVAAVEGSGDDDGFTVVKVDYNEPRMTPDSGFETTGIGFEFTEIIPELILDPQAIQGDGFGAVPAGDGTTSLGTGTGSPVATLFTFNERFIEGGPELIEGDSSRGLGVRIDPDAGDSITSVTIKGFPENSNPAESDWVFFPGAQLFDQSVDYQVNFLGSGPTQSIDGTWQIDLEVQDALPGESVEFILTVIPFANITDSVPLEIETTVDGSEGVSTSTAIASVGITFDQLLDGFASSGSGSVTEEVRVSADSEFGFTESVAVINTTSEETVIQPATIDIL